MRRRVAIQSLRVFERPTYLEAELLSPCSFKSRTLFGSSNVVTVGESEAIPDGFKVPFILIF